MYREIATTLYKRGSSSMDGYEMPGWAWIIVAANAFAFVPIFLIVNYTLKYVIPTLAIVEDPSPPAYDPISLNEDGQSIADEGLATADGTTVSSPPAITGSLRRTFRTLYSISGWPSLFRGYAAFLFMGFTLLVLGGILSITRLPGFVAAPLLALLVVQPYAAWTHIMISAPSPQTFWQRLPPFQRTFRATALPVIIYMCALELAAFLPRHLAGILNMTIFDPRHPNTLPQYNKDDAWKGVVVLLVGLALQVFVVIPAQIALTRVQASFLPEEHDTIVPFDRSFGGKVVPPVVGGKGYINMIDAWKSFPRASWIRLVKLNVKIFFIVVAVTLAWAAVLIPEYLLVSKNSRKVAEL